MAAKADPMNDLVEVRLFKDGDKYKDDVFVSVNDYSCKIKRGELVKVPRFVYEVLRNQEEQDANNAIYMSELSSSYSDKAKKAGLE